MSSTTDFRALIIEDNPDDALLLQNAIKKSGFQAEYLCVDNKQALLEVLAEKWDIIFSDYSMPTFSGHESLTLVRQYDPDVPFIFVSGTMGEANAVEAMRLGAQDYFIKGNFSRLAPAITRELRDSANRRSHRQAQERIHYLTNYDPLTGLPNRVLLVERLFALVKCRKIENKQVESDKKAEKGLSVFNVNIDRFREINDDLGVATTDGLLVEVGKRLCQAAGPEDMVARLAADEFVVVCPNVDGDSAANAMAETIFTLFNRPFKLARYEYGITVSIGSSSMGSGGSEPEQLLNNAAMALHHAQKIVGNSFLSYKTEMRSALQEKLALDRALEQALKRNEFQIHYQPQVSMDGRMVGMEALLRWNRPGVGPVSPMTFIPIAEESGLIMLIGDWVLREVCRQICQWREEGLPLWPVAINFSAHQFRHKGMPQLIRELLEEFELPPTCLEIEITETALMQDPDAARAILSSLRDLGISVALDDFGTGYSSLSYLKRFPVDILKIDREFVKGLPQDAEDCAIVQAIIAMCEKLGLKVVAEGVETAEQLDFLKQVECGSAQGYFFHRPLSAQAVADLVRTDSLKKS